MTPSLSSPLDLASITATTTNTNPNTINNPWAKWQRRLPFLKKLQQQVLRVPPRFRWAFVIFWFGWKILLALTMMAVLFQPSTESNANSDSNNNIMVGRISSSSNAAERSSYYSSISNIPLTGPATIAEVGGTGTGLPPTRMLYIVTTLAEYNTGTRATTKGQDRLGEVLIPVLVDSVQTMVQPPFNYHVDVYLICAYTLSPEREERIRQALPGGVGLQVWDNAAPLGYEARHSPDKVTENTRALARQHRYVIKDKAFHYDMFLAFEDDMRITGHHVEHFLSLSKELDRLRKQAPSQISKEEEEETHRVPENVDDVHHTKFYGDMTKEQLRRVIPGFVRVEVLLNETDHGTQTKVLPIDRDFQFAVADHRPDNHKNDEEFHHVDPRICCHIHMTPNHGTPETPTTDDLIIWETNVKAFSLRQFPPGSPLLDWGVLMMGPGKRMDRAELVGGYWSGREGAFGDEPRPSGGVPTLIAQQGGWMLTREQIARMHNELCLDSFLPPFDLPTYHSDGQDSMNVEFWSGSYQIFTGVKGGCNMQRVISMKPDHFSKHLIYHVANNKQRQLTDERMVRADHLFGQLNTVQKMAQKAMLAGAKK